MKLEDQVCSLELAKRLKEFGVKQESLFFYNSETMKIQKGFTAHNDQSGIHHWSISAFTVAELGEMLNGITITRVEHACSESGRLWSLTQHHWWMLDPNFLAEIICHLIEKGIVKP